MKIVVDTREQAPLDFSPFPCEVVSGSLFSQMKPHACLQSLLAFQVRYGVPFLLVGDRRAAAYFVYHILRHYVLEQESRFKAVLGNVPAA